MNRFLIDKVKIQNFRGYVEQEFDFRAGGQSKQGIIILGGSNGYGKTTLIDSIEWCFTGTIKRLRKNFIQRNENTLEMQRGLLRNTKVAKNAEIFVIVEGTFNKKPFTLKRTFNQMEEGKGLSPQNTSFEIVYDGVSIQGKNIDDLLKIPLSNRFYDRYHCSYEKNIYIYEKNRHDLYKMFSSFFGGLEEVEAIINNLDGYKYGEGKKRIQYFGLINELSSQVKNLTIENENLQLKYKEAQRESKETSKKKHINNRFIELFYNPVRIFEGEMKTEEIREHFEDLEQMYNTTKSHLDKFEKINDVLIYSSIQKQCELFYEYLNKSVKLEEFKKYVLIPFQKNKENIVLAQKYYVQHGNVNENIRRINEFIDRSHNIGASNSSQMFYFTEFEEKIFKGKILPHSSLLKKFTEKQNDINKQLDHYRDTRSPITKSLIAIVDNLNGYDKLRYKYACPLCGSREKFHQHSTDLGAQARKLLGQLDEERASLQNEYNLLQEKIILNINEYKNSLMGESYKKLDELKQLIRYFDTIDDLKLVCDRFNFNIYTVNEMDLIDYVEQIENELGNISINEDIEYGIIQRLTTQTNVIKGVPSLIKKENFMDKEEYFILSNEQKKESINSLIKFYNKQLEKMKEIKLVQDLEKIDPQSVSIRIDIFNEFKNELETKQKFTQAGILLNTIKKDLEENEKNLFDKIVKLDQLKKIRANIISVKNEYDRKVAEQINIPLKKVYRKLNRHTNIEVINLNKAGKRTQKVNLSAKVSDKKLHISNILSAGQLSIVSLSIFLTIALGQKEEPFKCYFMDDPIQTMDDVNILSLVDLLRVELSQDINDSNHFMDQLFITTCNVDFEKLLSHKMRSFDVNVTHFHFTSYGSCR